MFKDDLIALFSLNVAFSLNNVVFSLQYSVATGSYECSILKTEISGLKVDQLLNYILISGLV